MATVALTSAYSERSLRGRRRNACKSEYEGAALILLQTKGLLRNGAISACCWARWLFRVTTPRVSRKVVIIKGLKVPLFSHPFASVHSNRVRRSFVHKLVTMPPR